jgi:hypothetical protein
MIDPLSKTFPFNYRAKVLSVTDPLNLGRIKCEIYPMLIGEVTARGLTDVEGVPLDALPWAVPANPLFIGAKAGYGFFTVPGVDSYVWVFFEAGNIYQPVYFAEANDGVNGLPSGRSSTTTIWKTPTMEIVFDKTTGNISITGKSITITGSGPVTIQGPTGVIELT